MNTETQQNRLRLQDQIIENVHCSVITIGVIALLVLVPLPGTETSSPAETISRNSNASDHDVEMPASSRTPLVLKSNFQ